MTALVLRLAGPVQTWGGYRRAVKHSPTYAVPTLSGVAGLLAACLGERDHLSLLGRFGMRVRVDRSNPTMPDLQVAVGPTTPRERESADRAVRIATGRASASYPSAPYRMGLGGLYYRHIVPHAEFLVELRTDPESARQWLDACRSPVFTPYLGRHSNPPTWPFVLGVHGGPEDVLTALPRVGGPVPTVLVHEVTGDRLRHTTAMSGVEPPYVPTREEQMTWVTQNLER